MEHLKLKRIAELTAEFDQCKAESDEALNSNDLALALLKICKAAAISVELDAVKSTAPKQPIRERKFIACPPND